MSIDGQGVAKNIAIRRAKGKYLYFLDSDDYIENETLQKMFEVAEKNKCDIVVSNYNIIKNNQRIQVKTFRNDSDCIRNYVLCGFGQCWKLIKKDIIINNNLLFPEDIRFEEDSAVVPLYGLMANKIEFVDRYFYNYCYRENSLSNQKISEKNYDNIKAITYLLENSRNINNKYQEEIEYLIIENMMEESYKKYIKGQKRSEETIKWIDSNINWIDKNLPYWSKNKYIKNVKTRYYLIYKKKYRLVNLLENVSILKNKIKRIALRALTVF